VTTIGDALAVARLGLRVLPLHTPTDDGCSCGLTDCGGVGKRPWPAAWQRAASGDPDVIRGWWARWPEANVGILTGDGHAMLPGCALAVVDVEPGRGGDDELHRLEDELGKLPATAEVATGGNGRHLYYRAPAGLPSRDDTVPPRGVELKANGRQVVAPPSLHRSGRIYAWHPARTLTGASDLAQLPAAWVAHARREQRPAPAPRTLGARRAGTDPLAQLDPPLYFGLLAGRVPDRRGFVRCPLPDHADRTPSCHVYATAEAGWFCFGCRRGGTIYDLAALLAGERRPLTRGAFLRVKDSLLTFLERQAIAA
jgi:bifunctional DNA primase/polymerase-like protein